METQNISRGGKASGSTLKKSFHGSGLTSITQISHDHKSAQMLVEYLQDHRKPKETPLLKQTANYLSAKDITKVSSAYSNASNRLKTNTNKNYVQRHSSINSSNDLNGSLRGSIKSNSPAWSQYQRNNSAQVNEPKFNLLLAKKLRLQFKLENVQYHSRIILMLFCIFLIIIFCWCPIAINFIVGEIITVPSIVYVCFTVLAWTNSCVNVFIYAGLNVEFRQAYVNLLQGKRLEPSKHTEILSPAMIKLIQEYNLKKY